ncbi:Clp protease N-terminal domain-containing protein [Streptomyces erythrochromogenes]|uniref:Clp protease N-terminal domain-containing protein n=1 Tax=Streptomyces erythrochromogenes TaxID=285574 RepID=UPI0036BE6B35
MLERLTDRAQLCREEARAAALRLGHAKLAPEHLLIGILAAGNSGAARMLNLLGLSAAAVEARVGEWRPPSEAPPAEPSPYASRCSSAVALSFAAAAEGGQTESGPEHLLLGLIALENGMVQKILGSAGVDVERLRTALREEAAAWAGPRPDGPGETRSALATRLRMALFALAYVEQWEPERIVAPVLALRDRLEAEYLESAEADDEAPGSSTVDEADTASGAAADAAGDAVLHAVAEADAETGARAETGTVPDEVAELTVVGDLPSTAGSWTWRLTDAAGGLLAEHTVRLAPGDSRVEALHDLTGWLAWRAAPDDREAAEADLVADLGDWMGRELLGPVGPALLALAPVTVRVTTADDDDLLSHLPLDAARLDGLPLAAHRVSLVFTAPDARGNPLGEDAPGYTVQGPMEPPRMLAAFSLPAGSSAMAVRRERRLLLRLTAAATADAEGRADLRVLQYGVTRERLAEAFAAEAGWDLVHLSGHGVPGGLLLESEDGGADLVSGDGLLAMAAPLAGRVRLVVLSSCSLATTVTDRAKDALSLEYEDEDDDGESAGADPWQGLAQRMARSLGCAVVAMRYPIDDTYAVALTTGLYERLLVHGDPLPRALREAVLAAAGATDAGGTAEPVAFAAPVLLGEPAVGLRLSGDRANRRSATGAGSPDPGFPDTSFPTPGLPPAVSSHAGLPAEPEVFVGRAAVLAQASAALLPDSESSVVVLTGIAGSGKTTTALELAHRHADAFDHVVWHQIQYGDPGFARGAFLLDLARRIPSLPLAFRADPGAAPLDLDWLTGFLRERPVLIVLDGLERLLESGGSLTHPGWLALFDALAGHGGPSRLVLTSRRTPLWPTAEERGDEGRSEDEPPPHTVFLPLDALSVGESALLAWELPGLGELLRNGDPEVRALAVRTLSLVQGYPELLKLADALSRTPEVLSARLDAAEARLRARGRDTAVLADLLRRGDLDAATTAEDRVAVLRDWVSGLVGGGGVSPLPLPLALVAMMAEDERRARVYFGAFESTARPGHEKDWRLLGETLLGPPSRLGLIEVSYDDDGDPGELHMHPLVAQTVLAAVDEGTRQAATAGLLTYWLRLLQQAVEEDESGAEASAQVVLACRFVLPRVIEFGELTLAGHIAESLIARAPSAATAAFLLPLMDDLAKRAWGGPHEESVVLSFARCLGLAATRAAEVRLRTLLEEARDRPGSPVREHLKGELAALLVRMGQLTSARLVEGGGSHDGTSEDGEDGEEAGTNGRTGSHWERIATRGAELSRLNAEGHHEEVLAEVERLRTELAATVPTPVSQGLMGWNIRESILDQGVWAAIRLEQWDRATELNETVLELRRLRGADALTLAVTHYHGVLAMFGRSELAAARDTLMDCREVFEEYDDTERLAATLDLLAETEARRGNLEDAEELRRTALRLAYSVAVVTGVIGAHRHLATLLRDTGTGASADHGTAALLLAELSGDSRKSIAMAGLAQDLAQTTGSWTPPGSVRELAERIGADLDGLAAHLPGSRRAQNAVLADLVETATERGRAIPPFDLQAWSAALDPLLGAVAAASAGEPDAAATALLDEHFTVLAEIRPRLAAALRKIAAGASAESAAAGLVSPDTELLARLPTVPAAAVDESPPERSAP